MYLMNILILYASTTNHFESFRFRLFSFAILLFRKFSYFFPISWNVSHLKQTASCAFVVSFQMNLFEWESPFVIPLHLLQSKNEIRFVHIILSTYYAHMFMKCTDTNNRFCLNVINCDDTLYCMYSHVFRKYISHTKTQWKKKRTHTF